VGLGRPERLAEGAATGTAGEFDQAPGDRMGRDPDGNRFKASGDDVRHKRRAGQDQGQRAWGKGLKQAAGQGRQAGCQDQKVSWTGDMDNQRVIARPTFNLKYLLYCIWKCCKCPQDHTRSLLEMQQDRHFSKSRMVGQLNRCIDLQS